MTTLFDQDLESAIAEGARDGVRLITEGAEGEAVAEFGIVLGHENMARASIDDLMRIRAAVPRGSVAFTDTTSLLQVAEVLLTDKPPSPVSLLDLGAFINAFCLYDRLAYLGPVDVRDFGEVGGRLNEALGAHFLVSVGPDDIGEPSHSGQFSGLWTIQNRAKLALRQMFEIGRQRLESPPTGVLAEREMAVQVWSAILGGEVRDGLLYDEEVVGGGWRSSDAGYGRWLLQHFGRSSEPFLPGANLDQYLAHGIPVSRTITETHMRAIFNSFLAFYVLQIPYRCTSLRAPWQMLRGQRSQALERVFGPGSTRRDGATLLEQRLQTIVEWRRTQYQDPELAAVRAPAFFSLVLGRATSRESLIDEISSLRRECTLVRDYQSRLVGILGEEATTRKQQVEARRLTAALGAEIRTKTSVGLEVAGQTLSAGARLVSPPTWGTALDTASRLVSAAQDEGLLARLGRRLFRPELQWLSDASADAGAMLAARGRIQDIWKMQPRYEDWLWRSLTEVQRALTPT